MTYNTSPFRLIGIFLLSILTILSWTTVTALPTTHEVVALASPSAVRTSTTQDVTAPVDDTSDDSLSMQSYTEKMATGLFGRIPGLEALRRSMVPTPSPTGSYIYEFYGCFGQGFCNTTCHAYPTTDLEVAEAACSQINATYQRNVMLFDNHTECLNGANVPLKCGSTGAYPFYHYVRVA